MAGTNQRRWLVKNSDGHVRGPFSTDEVLSKISNTELTGDEQVALYPGTEWIPISQDPEFYDRLLELLEADRVTPATEPKKNESVLADADPTPQPVIEIPKPKNRVERVRYTKFGEAADTVRPQAKPRENVKNNEPPVSPQIIELARREAITKKLLSKNIRLAAVIGLAAIATIFMLMKSDNTGANGRIHLLTPRSGQPSIPAAQVKNLQTLAVQEFDQDNFSTYIQAEEHLVEVLEGDPKNSGAIALLCLNYLELWPYAQQDSQDYSAINRAVQGASAIDPASNDVTTCRTVDLIARGRYTEAKNLVESALDSFGGGAAQPSVAFYFLKAKLLDADRDPISAINYVQTAEQQWPQWLGLFTFEAELQAEAKNYQAAANRFHEILKTNPNHKVAQIGLGVLEVLDLNDPLDGKPLIERALESSERAPSEVNSSGYLALAELALRSGEKATALRFAQKAYVLNSLSARAKEIILQLGGEKTLKDTHVQDLQLVYEGDELAGEGDLNSAQAHYKEAFKENPKNGIAAMKAAVCLWQLSLSSEAIDWLNKAIHAEPKFIDAYTQLSDYFSQRYDYEAAGRVLNDALHVSPKSYKVMDGFALVELRRHDDKGAAEFAKKAVLLYPGDVTGFVILTRAELGLGQYPKAFESASHAIELDMNNREAQVAYARALGGARGSEAGINYLNQLVMTYPSISEYRLALGDMYMVDQNYPMAQKQYEQVIAMQDNSKKGQINLGKALEAQGKYEEAITAYFNAAELDPADAEPLFLAGMLYLAAHKPTDAQNEFQRVLKVNKDFPLVNYEIGRAALMLNAPEEALEQAKIEKEKNPNLADPYILAADAYTAMKQYSLCAGEYQMAVKLRPQGAEMYVKMARCYRLAGDLDAALSMINVAHDQESGNPEVWKEQGAIYDTRGDRQKAIEAYNQYIVLAPNAPDRDQVQARINQLSQ